MKTSHKLHVQFDEIQLLEDFKKVSSTWISHFNTKYYAGDWSGIQLREPVDKSHLLSPGNNAITEYQDTTLLKSLPYFQRLLSYFQCKKTSVRLLRLSAGSEIKRHVDPDLSFFDGDVRLHVPIATNDQIEFEVDNTLLAMLPGECWYADFSKPHRVHNKGKSDRIHLVIDMKVNDWLRNLFESEGILAQDEQAPDPIDQLNESQRLGMVRELLSHKTQTSSEMARALIKKYNLKP